MELIVCATREYISVNLPGKGGLCDATASASDLGEFWYVNRVFVTEAERGKGFGLVVLRRLLDEIVKMNNKRVVVEPGGYGSDPERLKKFYEKVGFRKTLDWMTWSSERCKPDAPAVQS